MSTVRLVMCTLVMIVGMSARMIVIGFGLGVVAFMVTGENADEWRFWLAACLAGVAYAFAALLEFAGNHLADVKENKEGA